MQETTVARSYAEALFELATRDDAIESYAEQLSQLVDLMESEPQFREFLNTPRIEAEDKKRVLREVFGGSVAHRFLKFLFVVVDKRRQRLLAQIADEFHAIVNEHFGRLQVEITTATEPEEALRATLARRLARVLGREILPRYRVDPRLIGGVIVKVGDRIMDGSIRHRLQKLRRNLLNAEVG